MGHAENSENHRGKYETNYAGHRPDVRPERVCELSIGTMSGGAAPSLALMLQESRSLPVEAYDAV